ncbi:MAG: ATP-binding protein [Aggregatilineales bacterium]
MTQSWSLTIAASYCEVRLAASRVAATARAVGLDEAATHHCQLAVDEACTNIVEHGYGGENAENSILIACSSPSPGCLVIEITDNAPAFNPLTADAQADQRDTCSLPSGGWGVSFIKRLMDSVEYRYERGQNHLLLKRCSAVEKS